jgi:hypothetical protein
MEPTRDTPATLVDLLDRVLDKGLIINADLIVSVAGIPLLGINLRAALAGMETMLRYGIMQAWDERTRAWEREHRKEKEIEQGQKISAATTVSKPGMTVVQDGMETCPQCGRRAPVKDLLDKGCPRCGWLSPRLKEQLTNKVVL